ncbi:unnamed protein product, partial [Polarella glacialis]
DWEDSGKWNRGSGHQAWSDAGDSQHQGHDRSRGSGALPPPPPPRGGPGTAPGSRGGPSEPRQPPNWQQREAADAHPRGQQWEAEAPTRGQQWKGDAPARGQQWEADAPAPKRARTGVPSSCGG